MRRKTFKIIHAKLAIRFLFFLTYKLPLLIIRLHYLQMKKRMESIYKEMPIIYLYKIRLVC
jgi:hypothetical protein